MKLYYWRDVPNFGDAIGQTILALLGIESEWAVPDEADLVVTGSILRHLRGDWQGTVLGAGKMYQDFTPDLRMARVLALRGPLTLASVKMARGASPALGDPALLISDWIPREPVEHEIGIVPHWSDNELMNNHAGHWIDVLRDPIEVVKDITRCDRIVSSSLHGLIIADAYGIPRRAELFRKSDGEGHDYKFRDYAALYNTHPHFGREWQAPIGPVERIRTGLRKAFAKL